MAWFMSSTRCSCLNERHGTASADRRNWIHRRAALEAPRTRRAGSQMFVSQPGGAGLAGGSWHGVGARGSAAAGVFGGGVCGCGYGVLFSSFDEWRGGVRGGGAQRGGEFRGGGVRGGGKENRLPGRAGARRRAIGC